MEETVKKIIERNKIIKAIREYFTHNNYTEVDTPILSPSLIPETTIEVFATTYVNPNSGKESPLYLIPSPEIFMKKLLAMGIGNIFQITKSFRNCEEVSSLHNPEFTMLEWYTVGDTYIESIGVTENLLRHLREQLKIGHLRYGETTIDLDSPFEIISVEELFKKKLGVNLSTLINDENYINHILEKQKLLYNKSSNWQEKFNQLFLAYIEPTLPKEHPVIVIDYPSKIKTLAKRHKNPDFSQRWELYIAGIEIANCYTEEDNPKNIREFLEQEEKKKEKALIKHKTDREFYKYFYNFPPCSGVAMGIERLMMIFLNKKEIRGVIPFSIFDSIYPSI